MADMMDFPETIKEFIKEYEFKDKKEIYTNGSELIPVFRVEQALDHFDFENKIDKLEKALDKACQALEGYSVAIYLKDNGVGSSCLKRNEWKDWCMKDE